MNNPNLLSLTPDLPTYKWVTAFLKVIPGTSYALYREMFNSIWGQVGNPQANMAWTNPDEWIPQRLNGSQRELAQKIWQDSQHVVNPRYTRGCWYLAKKHHLLGEDSMGVLRLLPAGEQFLRDPAGECVAQIDSQEGLLTLLQIVAEHSPARRSEILPGWGDFCRTFTHYQAEGVHASSLYDRLTNLLDRGLIERRGQMYAITEGGIHWLRDHAVGVLTAPAAPAPEQPAERQPAPAGFLERSQLQELTRTLTQQARNRLKDHLAHMNPYKFEHLIRLLLEEMGYTDVEVTSPGGDKGVDVVATIELGISKMREVVQVKRHTASIGRPIVDQLRGSLIYFNALKGTIITTGGFSQGAKDAGLVQGAAPIALIDGEKLIDLLMEYEIGMTKKSVDFFEFDAGKLRQFEDDAGQLEE